MGQLDSTCRAPPLFISVVTPVVTTVVDAVAPTVPIHAAALLLLLVVQPPVELEINLAHHRAIALQVVYLKGKFRNRIFHLIVFRLWVLKVVGYGLWLNLQSPTAPPSLTRPDLGHFVSVQVAF
jgi:hypothetical protein